MQNILIVSWPTPVHWAAKERTGRLLPWKSFTEEGSCLDTEAQNSIMAKERAVKPPQPGTFVQSKAGQHSGPCSPEVLLCFDVEWDVSPTDHSRGQRGPPALALHQISPCQVTAPHSHQAHTVLSLSASHQYRTNHTCMAVLKILKQQLWKYSTSGEGLKSPGLSQKP